MPHRVYDSGTPPICLWQGTPDCDAIHAFVLDALKQIGCVFVGASVTITNSQIGNLGEFVTYCVGHKKAFSDHRCYPANAYEPLNTISRSGIDLIWIQFAKDEVDDSVLLQEVKTTGGADMDIHTTLVSDYRKMFGRTSRETSFRHVASY